MTTAPSRLSSAKPSKFHRSSEGGRMAAINDNANIFVGSTLDLFNAMETLVQRDGDVAGAQQALQDAMKKIAATQNTQAGSGSTYTRRKQ
jgi:hypothetical protein